MKIHFVKPINQLSANIHKITVFISLDAIKYRQKLTPSPFTCLSYNHHYIPDFKVANKIFPSKSKLQITGPKTTDDIYALHNGKLNQVLIEFAPSAFYYLFHSSPSELVNITVPMADLFPGQKPAELLNKLISSKNYRSRVKLLQEFIVSIRDKVLTPVAYIEEALLLIDESYGNISVHNICKKINISERQCSRKFIEIVGISPIQYIKIRQLHFIINRIHLNHYQSIKELAYDTGFYDPAHFNNSFKKLTGMSPGAFIKSDEHIALDYFSDSI
jgi:AraC-like DNA-binding protein